MLEVLLVIVEMVKVHPGVVVADISDCIDDEGTPWCRWCPY